MEDTLGAIMTTIKEHLSKGLNPCFNGRYSRSPLIIKNYGKKRVLILVLMEDTLGVAYAKSKGLYHSGLNPCFNGRYSRSYG